MSAALRVFKHARVWTGAPGAPLAQALAVRDGVIVGLGSEVDVREAFPRGALEDLSGALVTPGIHDAHMHLATGSLLRLQVDLTASVSAHDAAERIARAARSVSPGDWIRAWGWDHTRWPQAGFPERATLDRCVPDHPVVATRVDGHTAWVNARALASLQAADPARHSGILLEQECERAVAAVPAPAEPARRAALEAALREATSFGITSLEDVTEPWALPLYRQLRDEAALPVRIAGWLPIDTDPAQAREIRREHDGTDPWIRVTTLKAFLDGTLGSRSAALWEPYADDPAQSGVLRVDPAELLHQLRAADADGWSLALHAIGDRALSVALDALEALPRRARLRPPRIEHVQVAAPRDLERMHRLDVLASVQPAHFLDDRAWIAQRLGPARDALAYPWRSLLEAGVRVAFGSDWPIAPMDPRRGILAAVTRARGELGPEEALSGADALRTFTSRSAAARGDALGGTLRAGAPADFVVWSGDPTAIESEGTLAGCRVRAVYVDGRRVGPGAL